MRPFLILTLCLTLWPDPAAGQAYNPSPSNVTSWGDPQ
jgi:hypothetical protein